MVDYKLIGKRLQIHRQNQGLTQEFVAEKAEITTVYLSKIENGHVRPTIDILSTICSIIGCDLGSIFLNTTPASNQYENEHVIKLFNTCSPKVKTIALELLERLATL